MASSVIEDLKELKERIDTVGVWDYPAKDDVIRRANVLARRAFGADDYFINQIGEVEFEGIAVYTTSSPPGPSSYNVKEWEDGKSDLKNIIRP